MYVYTPPVRKGGKGMVTPMNMGPRTEGLEEAKARLMKMSKGEFGAGDSRYPCAILMKLWPFLPLFLFIAMFSLVGATYPKSGNKLDLSLSIGTVIKDCADCPPMVAIPSVGRISISSSFHPLYVSRHELTWKEYLKAVREGGCVPPSKDLGFIMI